MAKEYIERATLLDEINSAPVSMSICMNVDECKGRIYERERLVRIIEAIPAADVVPVVRCADCKWFQINMRQDGYLPEGVPECECRHWCGSCDPTDFCSYGAKMDGDGE